MFGKMFGNLENQQRELQEKLSRITAEGKSGDGAVVVTANGNKELVNIVLDTSKLNLEDKEVLEGNYLAPIYDV
jgi:DNA-binding protein YbaB